MAVTPINFTTGPAIVPDVGVLSYNGCVFSPLFETTASGVAVKDNAQRTVKLMEYTITVDGYVTLKTGAASVAPTTRVLLDLLTAQGGALTYTGRGFDLVLGPGDLVKDVAWGPVPEVLDFQPLGAGKSAKVRWQVKVRIPRADVLYGDNLLQFNYETSVTYGEDGFSTLSMRGTMEIPLTRTPLQSTRTLTYTVDDFRRQIDSRVFNGIDLSRFQVTRRVFNVSRDKRTLEFDVEVAEKPYMDLPPDCTIARGTYNVRPAKAGMGLVTWLCTLRATYTVRADRPRRVAWLAFLALLRLRMAQSQIGPVPDVPNGDHNPPIGRVSILKNAILNVISPGRGTIEMYKDILERQGRLVQESRRAWLMDLSIDEGLYLDSKTTSFSATWRLNSTFNHILLSSGLWRKVPEVAAGPPDPNRPGGLNLWKASIEDVAGAESWLPNRLDPKLDIIVDFGGG